MITQKELKEWVSYSPETGDFTAINKSRGRKEGSIIHEAAVARKVNGEMRLLSAFIEPPIRTTPASAQCPLPSNACTGTASDNPCDH